MFSWLDGALILAYIYGVAACLGGVIWLSVFVAARSVRMDWRSLAPALTPLAGIGIFLGLSMMTATHLRTEDVNLSWLPVARSALLAAGIGWSAWLGLRLLCAKKSGAARIAIAFIAYFASVAAAAGSWVLVFHMW